MIVDGKFPFDGEPLVTNDDLKDLCGNSPSIQDKWLSNFAIDAYLKLLKSSMQHSYLEKRDIIPKYISVFRSQRRGTRSAKVHVPSSMALLVQTEKFWPEFVKCTPWQSKKVRNSTASKTIATHSGNYSSYV